MFAARGPRGATGVAVSGDIVFFWPGEDDCLKGYFLLRGFRIGELKIGEKEA